METYKRSPWGQIDNQYLIAEGILSVSTPSHGGLKLSADRQKQMPDFMRSDDGWYEEDCEWAKVFVVFQADILTYGEEYAVKAILSGQHIQCLKNWYPDAFEKFYDTVLTPGESYIRSH